MGDAVEVPANPAPVFHGPGGSLLEEDPAKPTQELSALELQAPICNAEGPQPC